MPQDPAVRSQGPNPPAETEIDELERAADIPLGVSRAPRARAPRGQAASSVGSGDRQPLFATKSQASERSRGERCRSLAPDAKAPHASSISSWLQASENVAPPSGNASATGGSSHAGGLRGNSASSARGALPRYRSGGGPPSASSHRSHILPAPGRLMKSDYPDAASMRAMSNSSRLPRGARGSASIAAGAPGENVETVPEGGDLSAKTWERIASWREVSARALGSDAAEHEGASVSAAKNTQHGAARGAADASAAHKTPESSDALRRRPARPDPAIEMNTPLRNALRALTHEGLQDRIVALGIAGGLLVRALVALGGWSGRGRPPMYGDFEAQRHWIELTLHLPPAEWYRYDLQYWGLDYPPLTAWTSLLCGWVASGFPRLRTAFELDSSRGAEHTALAVFMRACVALLELAVYVPAVSWFLERRLEGRSSRTRHVALLSALLQPALILVDHGHHQYNSVMLGLAAMSFALLYSKLPNVHNGSSQPVRGAPDTHRLQVLLLESLSRQISYEYVVAAVFFTLSLCFKQMALYYAPAVFAIMLGRCVGVGRADLRRGLALFAGLGAATLATSALLFLPWLGDLAQCVHRIFPLARGVFEDKVASVWCLLSVLPLGRFKPREALPPAALAKLSAAATLAAILPGCVLLFRAAVQTAQLERVPDDAMAEQVVAHVQQRRPTSVASGRTSQVHAGPRSVASQRMPSGVRDTLAAPSARRRDAWRRAAAAPAAGAPAGAAGVRGVLLAIVRRSAAAIYPGVHRAGLLPARLPDAREERAAPAPAAHAADDHQGRPHGRWRGGRRLGVGRAGQQRGRVQSLAAAPAGRAHTPALGACSGLEPADRLQPVRRAAPRRRAGVAVCDVAQRRGAYRHACAARARAPGARGGAAGRGAAAPPVPRLVPRAQRAADHACACPRLVLVAQEAGGGGPRHRRDSPAPRPDEAGAGHASDAHRHVDQGADRVDRQQPQAAVHQRDAARRRRSAGEPGRRRA